jgi:hypothetical protein
LVCAPLSRRSFCRARASRRISIARAIQSHSGTRTRHVARSLRRVPEPTHRDRRPVRPGTVCSESDKLRSAGPRRRELSSCLPGRRGWRPGHWVYHHDDGWTLITRRYAVGQHQEIGASGRTGPVWTAIRRVTRCPSLKAPYSGRRTVTLFNSAMRTICPNPRKRRGESEVRHIQAPSGPKVIAVGKVNPHLFQCKCPGSVLPRSRSCSPAMHR